MTLKDVRCVCQLCGLMKNIGCWSPKNEDVTYRLLGIKGSNLPICVDCILKKQNDPQYFIKSLEEFLKLAKREGFGVDDINKDPESDH